MIFNISVIAKKWASQVYGLAHRTNLLGLISIRSHGPISILTILVYSLILFRPFHKQSSLLKLCGIKNLIYSSLYPTLRKTLLQHLFSHNVHSMKLHYVNEFEKKNAGLFLCRAASSRSRSGSRSSSSGSSSSGSSSSGSTSRSGSSSSSRSSSSGSSRSRSRGRGERKQQRAEYEFFTK